MHPPGDRRQVLRLHLHRPRHLRLRRVGDLGEISRLHRFQQVGGIARPPVGQGGDVVGQLDGGDLGALLTDGHGQHVALIPFAPKGLGKLRAGHHTSGLGQLHPCLLTQAELGGVLVQLLDAHPPAYIIEEVVAGYLDGVGYVDRSVGASILAVDPALRLGRRPIGVLPLIPDDGGGGDDLLLQPGHLLNALEDVLLVDVAQLDVGHVLGLHVVDAEADHQVGHHLVVLLGLPDDFDGPVDVQQDLFQAAEQV